MTRFSIMGLLLLLVLAACANPGRTLELHSVSPAQVTLGEGTTVHVAGENIRLSGWSYSDRENASGIVVMACGKPLQNLRLVDPQQDYIQIVPIGEIRGRYASGVTGTLSPDSMPGVSDVTMTIPNSSVTAVLQAGIECIEPNVVPPLAPSIAITPTSITLDIGESATFTATVEDAPGASLVWSIDGGQSLSSDGLSA